MKKTLVKSLPQPNDLIELDTLTSPRQQFYGLKADDGKGFIGRQLYNQGDYVLHAASAVTNGNRWTHVTTGSDLLALLKKLLTDKAFTIYVFDTAQELFAWLAE